MYASRGLQSSYRPPPTGLRTGIGSSSGRENGTIGGRGGSSYTEKVYGLIRDEKYEDAIRYLNMQYSKYLCDSGENSSSNVLFVDNNCISNNTNNNGGSSSRCVLSLIGYCNYMIRDFEQASYCYNQLLPYGDEYKIYYAQSLMYLGRYEEALRVITPMQTANTASTTPVYIQQHVHTLSSYIRYYVGDVQGSHSSLDICNALVPVTTSPTDSSARKSATSPPLSSSATTTNNNANAMEVSEDCVLLGLVLRGCIHIQEGEYLKGKAKFEEALEFFNNCTSRGMYQVNNINLLNAINMNISLALYLEKNYHECLKFANEVVVKALEEYPEFQVSMRDAIVSQKIQEIGGDAQQCKSVGNSKALSASRLIEAYNMKFAVEYAQENFDAANETLMYMPYRTDEELDSVSLHNIAISSAGENPNESCKRLSFLRTLEQAPTQTTLNLLLLYCK